MDERTLDRIARTAGIIKNRAETGAAVMHWGCSVASPPELGEFASDVLELVAEVRSRPIPMGEADIEALRAAIEPHLDREYTRRPLRDYVSRPAVAEAVTITTDDVGPDLFAPVAGMVSTDDLPKLRENVERMCEAGLIPAPEFTLTVNGQTFRPTDIKIEERRYGPQEVKDFAAFFAGHGIAVWFSGGPDGIDLYRPEEVGFNADGTPRFNDDNGPDDDDEDDWGCIMCGEDPCACDDEDDWDDDFGDDGNPVVTDDDGETD